MSFTRQQEVLGHVAATAAAGGMVLETGAHLTAPVLADTLGVPILPDDRLSMLAAP